VSAIDIENPATGATLREVPALSAEQVAELVAAARAAQPQWQALGFAGRGEVFTRARKWLMANQDRMLDTICSETGKTRDDAQVEVTVAAGSFQFWAKHAQKYLADERFRSFAPLAFGRKVVVRYEPVGVVGVIGPWNYPLVNAFCDCVPALMAGNACVLKPSEVTPLTALLVEEMLQACGMPADVFSVACGAGETGAALVDAVDFLMFTGSTATGQKIMERAAKTLTPVSLELGGKDPMIVCADADVERAANAAAYYGLNNAGQVCISVERVYVEAPVYDEFIKRLTSNVAKLRQGPPGAAGEVEVGAITHPPQIEIIERHVQDAKEKGASVLTGGRRKQTASGRFYEPTVLVGVDHTMSCMTEETFGPTIPVMRVADTEEAIRMANDSPYGLQGSVFTKDVKKGEAIARRMQCGAVCLNDAQVNYMVFDAPMGGWKTSGVGSRHGAGGIRKYCRSQTILLSGFMPKKDLHMFPYKPRVSKLMSRAARWMYGR
jgi:acyl-CoA reductase-like NAD-dependent aldehyde dehydrogenase